MESDRVCDQCGRWIEPNEYRYRLRLEIVAEPGPEIQLESADLPTAREEWERLVARLEKMSAEQVREAEDAVHETFDYWLCPDCRAEFHKKLRHRREFPGFD